MPGACTGGVSRLSAGRAGRGTQQACPPASAPPGGKIHTDCLNSISFSRLLTSTSAGNSVYLANTPGSRPLSVVDRMPIKQGGCCLVGWPCCISCLPAVPRALCLLLAASEAVAFCPTGHSCLPMDCCR